MSEKEIPPPDFDFPTVEKISAILKLNQEVTKDILNELIETLPGYFDKLHQLISVQNREEVKTVSHTIKGSCGNMRIEGIRKLAEEIEKMNPFTFEEALVKYEKMKDCFEQLKLFYGKQ